MIEKKTGEGNNIINNLISSEKKEGKNINEMND